MEARRILERLVGTPHQETLSVPYAAGYEAASALEGAIAKTGTPDTRRPVQRAELEAPAPM
ncbi:hypothetical protein [Streptomyces sp. NPDC005407]|uniref:hypothetical protein n=1 Tax=Streptomyces sp. NPDC005407 TaxID=3155340 RepID=UPI0033B1A65B